MSDRQNALKVTQILQNFAKNVGYKMESIRNVRYIGEGVSSSFSSNLLGQDMPLHESSVAESQPCPKNFITMHFKFASSRVLESGVQLSGAQRAAP